MIAGSSERKTEEEEEKFVKHESFDNYILKKREKCKGKHLPH